MKTTKVKFGVFHFEVLLVALILQLSFISVGNCTLTIPGPVGVVFNPAFPPSVPSTSATGATTYTYQWSVAATGYISVSSDGQCSSPPPDVGLVSVSGYADTTEETTVQGGDDITTGALEFTHHGSGNSGCGAPWCSGNSFTWSSGTIAHGTNTTTGYWICSDSCPGSCGPYDFYWPGFINASDYPCSSNLTTVTYQATNSSGDLLWQISFTYPTNSCWFAQQAYISDCCLGVAYQPYIRGASAYFEVYVYMAAGVTPPPLSSFGMYTGAMRLYPGLYYSVGDNPTGGGGGSGGGSGGTPGPGAPNGPAVFPANGPLGRNIAGGGGGHVLYVKENGSVWGWGDNSYGQLGTTTVVGQTTNAVQASGLPGIIQVSAGQYHSLALATNGMVWAWGRDDSGQVGLVSGSEPLAVTNPINIGITGAVSIAASFNGNSSYAVLTNGTVMAWGVNAYGQLGLGYTNSQSAVALPVTNLSGVVAVAAGDFHVLALTTNGTVYAWGRNVYGQLGNGSSGFGSETATPTLVTSLTNLFIVQVAAGDLCSYAIDNTGNVWAWGLNTAGQLGIGTNVASSSTPVRIVGLGGTNAIIGIAPGYNHCLAEGFDGSFWAWGGNSRGQLGDGTTTASLVPEHLSFPDGSVSSGIAGGFGASFSIQSDLSVRSWGTASVFGKSGQLGRVISGSYSPTPGQVNPF